MVQTVEDALQDLRKPLDAAIDAGKPVIDQTHMEGFLNHRRHIAGVLAEHHEPTTAQAIASGYIMSEMHGIAETDPLVARADITRRYGPVAGQVTHELMARNSHEGGRHWHGWQALSPPAKDAMLASWTATLEAKSADLSIGRASGTSSLEQASGGTIAAAAAIQQAEGFGGSPSLMTHFEARLLEADGAYMKRFGTSPRKNAAAVLSNAGVPADKLPPAMQRQAEAPALRRSAG